MEKLTGKGKHTIKIGYHPHTKLVKKLKDKSSKIQQLYPQQEVKGYTKQLDGNLQKSNIVIMRGGAHMQGC